jgi:hypothetical protein
MALAFTVEDGNGLPTANAYVDTGYADDYFALRGDASWAAATDQAKQIAIVKATDYIDKVFGPRFLGSKANVSDPPDETVDQALEFPRDTREAYVGNPDYVDVNYVYPFTSVYYAPLTFPVQIPNALKKACCEYANRALANGTLLNDPTVDPSGIQVETLTEKVGPIETTTHYYNLGGIAITQSYPAADMLLKPLLKASGRVIR